MIYLIVLYNNVNGLCGSLLLLAHFALSTLAYIYQVKQGTMQYRDNETRLDGRVCKARVLNR